MKTDMRVILTKRLLREGLLSLLKEKPLSRITVTDLCQASGVNRATFYNHYETVPMILRDILREYAEKIEQTFRSEMSAGHTEEAALEACLSYLLEKKEEISFLFSRNTESYMSGYGLEIVNDFISRYNGVLKKQIGCSDDEITLYMITTASGAYGLILTWLTNDMKQSPKEITAILRKLFTIRSVQL